MPSNGLSLLAAQRISRVANEIRDIRELPGRLRFLQRTVMTPATDAEIIALVTQSVHIAAVIPDDAAAPVYGGDSVALEVNHLANIKHGVHFTQERIMLLSRIANGMAGTDEISYFTDWVNRTILKTMLGVEQRMEHLLIGAALDTVSYDKHDTVFTVGFGAPSDLKVTKSGAGLWSAPTTATPMADIQTMQALGREKYGVDYNRITLNSATFREMIATTEFREKATLYSQLILPTATNFPVGDIPTMTALAGRILNLTIELYDDQYTDLNNAGTETRTKFVPNDKVIFTSTAFDNSPDGIDFGNSIVTESLIGSLTGITGGIIGQLPGAVRGPVSYATAPNDMNPPNITMWCVARGFPRRMFKAATAVLTV